MSKGSKRKSHKGKSPTKQSLQPKRLPVSAEVLAATLPDRSPHLTHVANRFGWLSVAMLWAVMLFTLYEYHYNHDTFVKNLQVLPDWADYLLLGLYVVLMVVHTVVAQLRMGRRRSFEPPFLSKLRIIGATVNTVLAVLSAVIVLYVIGVVAAMFELLQTRVFPGLNPEANQALSFIITVVLTKIIQEVAWRILTRIAQWGMTWYRQRRPHRDLHGL